MRKLGSSAVFAIVGLLTLSPAHAQSITPYQSCIGDLPVICAAWTESTDGVVLQACVNEHLFDCEGLRDSEKGEPNPLKDLSVYAFCGAVRGFGVACFA